MNRNIRSLNEAFEKMFEDIANDETFNEDFNEQYAFYASEIDEDSETMYKMYKTGNVSPAEALESVGYVDGEGDSMVCEINSNGITYTKVFEFKEDGSYTYYVLEDGEVPSGWSSTTATLDESEISEDVKPLQERIPKDLAKAYDKSRVHSYATRNYDSTGKVDFENSEYKEITPEEAMALKKEGGLNAVKALINGELVTFYNDGSQDNFIQYLPHNKKYTTRTGRDEYNSKYVPLKHILSVADKLYLADEKTVDPEKMKARLGLDDDGRYPGDQYDPSGHFSSQRDANLELGKHRRDGWGTYGDFEKKYHQRAKDKLAELEARWEDGDISRKDYEKYKASYQDEIDKYEGRRLKDLQHKRDRTADARNYASNIEATSAVRTFKQLKRDMASTQRYVDSAAAKVADLKANASNSSDYDYAKKELSKLKYQLYDIQHRIDYYEKRLADAENGAEIARYEADMQKYLNQLSNAQGELNKLLRRDR